jgi:lipopolysaccharide/colanic/teichoic acid biosynthesis glycosyltransferase
MFSNRNPSENVSVNWSLTQQASIGYFLRWKSKKLIVQPSKSDQMATLDSLVSQDWLIQCLQNSLVKLIKLDLDLSPKELEFWADCGMKAGKKVYVRLPTSRSLPQKKNHLCWLIKRFMDYLVTGFLLFFLSPIIVLLSIIVYLQSQPTIFVYQWHISERGKIFQSMRFRTKSDDDQWLWGGQWIHEFKLDRLSKLLNVLRGDISLVGSCPWKLKDASHLDRHLRYSLNAIPGITGAWQVESHLESLDRRLLNYIDVNYVLNWSLWNDFKFLFLTLPHFLRAL